VVGLRWNSHGKSAGYSDQFNYNERLGQPMITIKYTGSNVLSFDFESFSFFCAYGKGRPSNNPTAHTTSCDISVTGFVDGRNVAKQSFRFNASKHEKVGMAQAVLSGAFKGVEQVVFYTHNAPDIVATVLEVSGKAVVMREAYVLAVVDGG